MALSSPHSLPAAGFELSVSIEVSPIWLGTPESQPALGLHAVLDLVGPSAVPGDATSSCYFVLGGRGLVSCDRPRLSDVY